MSNQGFSYKQTNDASNQANIGTPGGMQPSLMDIPSPGATQEQNTQPTQTQAPAIQTPTIPQAQPQPIAQQPIQENYSAETDEIEALIESIIEEKWQTMVANIGDLNVWKQKTRQDVQSTKQELLRLQARFENLEKAILGKVTEYDKHMVNVSTELKAMEQVFQKILQPLTSNIKELSKITAKLKYKN